MKTRPDFEFLGRATPGMRGLSLVELMVAMAIGLVLLSAIGYVYMGSRETFRTMDDFSRIQENYRYAMDQIGVDVRMAGYSGCVNVSSIDPANPGNIPLQPPAHPLAQAVRGYADGAGWAAPANYVAGTDVLQVTAALGQGTNLTGPMPSAAGAMPINGNPAGFEAGDTLLISDCATAEVFTAKAVGGGASITPVAALSKIYSSGADVYPLVDTFYYIGTNPAGNRAIYRIQNGGNADELVENVEDIELRFGIDTSGDFAIDNHVAAGGVGDWRQVLSVRVNLVFVSDNKVATGAKAYVVEGVATNPGDALLRQVATATYGIRNRLP
jgi:type IV pilus assembly protein PilW